MRHIRKEESMKKIAVLFPGIGYNCDRPLLYYTGKLASSYGYEIKKVEYGGFESGIKGNREKMQKAFYNALSQAEKILVDLDWNEYSDIIFIGKSVGTIVSAAYMKKYNIIGRNIVYTPLEDTFLFAGGSGIVFHGTKDPWAENTDSIKKCCEKIGQSLYIVADANHSLETGNILNDIDIIKDVLISAEAFINQRLQRDFLK